MEVWSVLMRCLQQDGKLFPASVAPLCARGQTISFSSPASHMPTCSLKDPYRAHIKGALVNFHIVL